MGRTRKTDEGATFVQGANCNSVTYADLSSHCRTLAELPIRPQKRASVLGGATSKVTSLQKARAAALERVYRGNASFSFERETGSRDCRNALAVKPICRVRRRENTPKQTFIGRGEIAEVQSRFEATVAALSPNDCGAALAGPVRSIMRKSKS